MGMIVAGPTAPGAIGLPRISLPAHCSYRSIRAIFIQLPRYSGSRRTVHEKREMRIVVVPNRASAPAPVPCRRHRTGQRGQGIPVRPSGREKEQGKLIRREH